MFKKIYLAAIQRKDNGRLLSIIIQWIVNKEWKQRDQVEGYCNRRWRKVDGVRIYLGNRVNRVC